MYARIRIHAKRFFSVTVRHALHLCPFSKSDEPLEWSKLRISIDNGTETMDCSKGNFTSNDIGRSKVKPKLSSDGMTFTVMVDATSEDEFTYLDLPNLIESNQSSFNLRFSKTDIFLSENVTGTIIEGKNFEDIVNNMKSFSEELVDSEIDQTILQVDETMSSLDLVLKDVNSGNGSLGKFIKDGDFYMEMNESMAQLELLLKDMRENPKRYVHFSLFGRNSSSSDTIK